MDLPEEIEKEVDHMIASLEKGRPNIEKKFKSMMEEFISDAWNNFDWFIQDDARYHYKRWIKETVGNIINSLLSGDTKYLKENWIISEYSWEELQKVRLAIWEAAGGEIANSTIAGLQKEIEEQKKEITRLHQYCQ